MKKIALSLFLIFMATSANATDYVAREANMTGKLSGYLGGNAVKIGSGDFYWRGILHIYHATLYTSDGKFDWNKSFALDMVYTREIDGDDIAEQSISEMKKIGVIDDEQGKIWQKRLEDIFPDMKDGSSLTGIYRPGKATLVYDFNTDKKISEIDDLDFSRKFFSIWLGDKPFDQKLSEKLLGTAK